jgi:hypothetical protein
MQMYPSEIVPYSNKVHVAFSGIGILLCTPLSIGGAPDTRQLAQLQILYSARGRKLDEVTRSFEALKEETSREIRIMKHKMAQVEGKFWFSCSRVGVFYWLRVSDL